MKFYLDSSFIIELVYRDPLTLSVLAHMDGPLYTSKLGRVETIRTVMKVDSTLIERALEVLNTIQLVDIRDEILKQVESYGSDVTLKTSDAIHVTTAKMLFRGHEGILVTRDKQMAKNAKSLGLKVMST